MGETTPAHTDSGKTDTPKILDTCVRYGRYVPKDDPIGPLTKRIKTSDLWIIY